MISRRLLRVKVLHMMYAHYKNEGRSTSKTEKELFFSIGKTYDLYHYLLLLIVDIAQISQSKIERAKEKRMPSFEDINPNTKFVDNQIIKLIASNDQLLSYAKKNVINWSDEDDFLHTLRNSFLKSDLYMDYMAKEETSFEDDKKFVSKFFSHFLASSELFYSVIEDKSIYWHEDIDFILSMVIKTIKKFTVSDDELSALPSLYKDPEDERFVQNLFRRVMMSHQEYLALIKKYTKNWDVDRIAFMDVLVMELALAEIVEFPSIPVKVSFNEYLEIVKAYSTKNSSNFINGILDKSVEDLKKEGKIKKIGRGLVDSVK